LGGMNTNSRCSVRLESTLRNHQCEGGIQASRSGSVERKLAGPQAVR
jgi:hypothetical protein